MTMKLASVSPFRSGNRTTNSTSGPQMKRYHPTRPIMSESQCRSLQPSRADQLAILQRPRLKMPTTTAIVRSGGILVAGRTKERRKSRTVSQTWSPVRSRHRAHVFSNVNAAMGCGGSSLSV